MATCRIKINNKWRGSLHRVVHFLIVEEFLNDSVLDMTLDVMVAEYFFTQPYKVMLTSRTEWRGTSLERAGS